MQTLMSTGGQDLSFTAYLKVNDLLLEKNNVDTVIAIELFPKSIMC